MKKIEEAEALTRLRLVKQRFADYINRNYAFRAFDCSKCPTPCCAEAQFVNVNITRLEAIAVWRTLQNSPRISPEKFAEVFERARTAVDKYRLSNQGDTFKQTYSCPLFERGAGCLVHWKAKPAPCIQHGCYENWQDLPDTAEFARVERRVEQLNQRVYGDNRDWGYQTIPVWLKRIAEEMERADHKESL